MSITKYYTQFKILFDELDEIQPLPECSCGASKSLTKRDDDQHVHLFLGGLTTTNFITSKASSLTLILSHHCATFSISYNERNHNWQLKQKDVLTLIHVQPFTPPNTTDQSGANIQNSSVTTVVRISMAKKSVSKLLIILHIGNLEELQEQTTTSMKDNNFLH